MSYSDDATAHDMRVKGLFALYNARRFDEMLTHYCDNVICFLPTVIEGSSDMQWSQGKAAYRANLEIFHDLFGKFTVQGVFATSDSSSVIVTDERGNTGTFSFEVTPERKVTRVFFHHQPGGAAKSMVNAEGHYKHVPSRAT